MMKSRISVLALVIAGLGYAVAGEVQPIPIPVVTRDSPVWPAVEAYRNGWDFLAVGLATPLAKDGNADALFLMGLAKETKGPAQLSRGQAMAYCYREAGKAGHPEGNLRALLATVGSNVKEERNEARTALETAAGKNDRIAQRLLGEGWLRSVFEKNPDPAKAKEWWEKSAKLGDTASLVLLGKMYDGTFGFPELTNGKTALEYYRQAVQQGDDSSLVPLGKLLLGKDESIRNENEGRAILAKAIAKGSVEAYRILGDIERESGKDRSVAMAEYRKGAEAGDLPCMYRMAMNLLGQDGGKEEGLQWLRKAASAGNPEAAADLGKRLAKDEPKSACGYLLLAANEGNPKAQYDLAMLYLNGDLGYRDATSAVAWLSAAMKTGDAETQYALASLHEQGVGCPINYANAGMLYTVASNRGHGLAAGRIAYMASEGLGTKLNIPQAWAYATLAVERGDESSRELLAAVGSKLDAEGKAAAAQALDQLKGGSALPVGNEKAESRK